MNTLRVLLPATEEENTRTHFFMKLPCSVKNPFQPSRHSHPPAFLLSCRILKIYEKVGARQKRQIALLRTSQKRKTAEYNSSASNGGVTEVRSRASTSTLPKRIFIWYAANLKWWKMSSKRKAGSENLLANDWANVTVQLMLGCTLILVWMLEHAAVDSKFLEERVHTRTEKRTNCKLSRLDNAKGMPVCKSSK